MSVHSFLEEPPPPVCFVCTVLSTTSSPLLRVYILFEWPLEQLGIVQLFLSIVQTIMYSVQTLLPLDFYIKCIKYFISVFIISTLHSDEKFSVVRI